MIIKVRSLTKNKKDIEIQLEVEDSLGLDTTNILDTIFPPTRLDYLCNSSEPKVDLYGLTQMKNTLVKERVEAEICEDSDDSNSETSECNSSDYEVVN